MGIFRRKPVVKFALIMMAAVVAIFSAIYLISPAFLLSLGHNKGGAAAAELFNSDRLNIVLFGFDGNKKRKASSSVFRTDTIMVATVNLKTKEAALVSIPRDSYVKIAGTDYYDKINHAYVHGYNAGQDEDKHQSGIDTAIRTVEDFLGGIPIHYYIAVDMDGVAEVVDRVGGVYFDVPYPVRTNYGRGRLLVDQGYQLLDGKKFLHYVRDRSVGGDFGRASRQQGILVEAFQQIKERGKLRDIPAMYRSIQDNLETDLSPAQIAQLALLGLKMNTGEITTHVFEGGCQTAPSNGINISYVVIDEVKRLELIEEVFGVRVPERPQITLPGPIRSKPDPAPEAVPQPKPEPAPAPAPAKPVEKKPVDPVIESPPINDDEESGEPADPPEGETPGNDGQDKPAPGGETNVP